MQEFLFADFETKSKVDLKKVGLDAYARHPSTKVLMLGYALNDFAPGLWLPHEKPDIPARLRAKLEDPNVVLVAYNAPFERAIFKHVLGIDIPLTRWICVQAMALSLSLPGNLDQVCEALNLGPEFAKSKDGKALIHLFCKPSSLKANKGEFNDHTTHPGRWFNFCSYCKLDVVAERKVYCILRKYMVKFDEYQALWRLDQDINEFGLPVDRALIAGAQTIMAKAKEVATEQLREISGLKNPNSTQQVLGWLCERGYPFASLKKARVKIAMKDFKDAISKEATKFLKIRLLTNKASVKKFNAMSLVNVGGFLRYMFQFCGAGRTARWAGRVVQLQNLARPHPEVEALLDEVRQIIREGDYEFLREIFSSPLDVLGSSVRSAICAPEGQELVVADLSAIELVVSAWHTKSKFWLQVLREKKDPYCAFGEHLYNVPYEVLVHEYRVLKNKKRRNGAKPGALGAQYRLGGGDLVGEYPDQERTGLWGYAQSLGVELTREESHHGVKVYRDISPEVVQEWYDLENAAMECVATHEPQRTPSGVYFDYKAPFLRMRLPSGRFLFYCQPKLKPVTLKGKDGEEYTKISLTYMGTGQKSKKWERQHTHGGKLFENFVQAAARDILAHGMQVAAARGFRIVGHVHDEIITLRKKGDQRYGPAQLVAAMVDAAPWMKDMPLDAAGYASEFFKKD